MRRILPLAVVTAVSLAVPSLVAAQSTTGQTGTTRDSSTTGAGTAGSTQMRSSGTLDTSISSMTAERLIGRDVYDSTGREIGEIEDIVFNREGRVTAALVDVGGFLGVGQRRVALDLTQVRMQDDRLVLQTMTRDQMQQLPPYSQGNDWNRVDRNTTLGAAGGMGTGSTTGTSGTTGSGSMGTGTSGSGTTGSGTMGSGTGSSGSGTSGSGTSGTTGSTTGSGSGAGSGSTGSSGSGSSGSGSSGSR